MQSDVSNKIGIVRSGSVQQHPQQQHTIMLGKSSWIKPVKQTLQIIRPFSVSSGRSQKSYHLVVIGGGSGGIATLARFARLNKGAIAAIEPAKKHYYQPLWTLVGAGLKDVESSRRDMGKVMPKNVDWLRHSCVEIDPGACRVRLDNGETIGYDYLVVAAGIQLDWHKVDGLVEALKTEGVCSNYSVDTVDKTRKAIQGFRSGNAIFTFPNTPIKCAGAPQKIMYLTDAYLRQNGKRSSASLSYHTSLPAIFGVKHYAQKLMTICQDRDLEVNLRQNLVRIEPLGKKAYLQNLDKPAEAPMERSYEMLHVTPPMSAASFLAPLASDQSNGFVAVDAKTLQHTKYANVFALGDCSSLPTSKTAAAIASQNYILFENLRSLMENKPLALAYDGYTSCPLVTGFNKCIMAEFDYQLQPLESFPVDQSVERTSMYYIKKDVLPWIYWNSLLKGTWAGPGPYRKLMHFGK